MRRHYGVVDGRYKLIHFYEDDVDEWELIDLAADPLEQVNFYDHPDYRGIRGALKKELDRLRGKFNVPKKDPTASFEVGDTPARYRFFE